jgi:6-pyruvoyltetrahydropterin/6-carboxytetrahydropterin synthase
MYRIAKRYAFAASHVLEGLGEQHPCARLHGHNYEVDIVAESDELDAAGVVVDFSALDDVKHWIDAALDHRHLNDVMEAPPSAEAIAKLIFDWCRANLRPEIGQRITAVRVWETPRAYAEYQRDPDGHGRIARP